MDHIYFDYNRWNPLPINMDGVPLDSNCRSREETKWDRPTFLIEKDVRVKDLIVRDVKMVNRIGMPIAFFECNGLVENPIFENYVLKVNGHAQAGPRCNRRGFGGQTELASPMSATRRILK